MSIEQSNMYGTLEIRPEETEEEEDALCHSDS